MHFRRLTLALLIVTIFHQSAHAELQVYEGFDYEMTELGGQDGGFGWGGPWERIDAGVEPEAVFDVSQDGVSLVSPVYPVPATGGRLMVAGPGGSGSNNVRIARPLETPFNLSQEGNTLYASFLLQKDVSGGTTMNNFEFDLISMDLGIRARFGSTSIDQFFLNATDTLLGTVAVNPPQPYFLVLKVEANPLGEHMTSALVFDPLREVPDVEPEVWDATRALLLPTDPAPIDGARFWIGRLPSGQFDEVRLGTTWESVTVDEVMFPDPTLPGDFNDDGTVDAADYVVWRKGVTLGTHTPEQYDEWTANFGMTTGGGAAQGTASLAAIPEPSALTLLVLAFLLAAGRRPHAFVGQTFSLT